MDIEARMREVEQEIISRRPEHSVDLALDRMAELVGLLGDPQRACPVIHVTGTNGKTSTARMTHALLRSRGLRTGRFTSPHLVSIRERIVVDGAPVDPERFVAAYEEIIPYVNLVDERHPAAMSFFEVLTGMAFAIFADTPVDVVVLEVGVGGRLDCTNVADSVVAIITPIAIDHTRLLGDTIEEIAGEKAGIIKPGAVAVLAQQPLAAAEVLLRHAAEVGATVAREGVEFGVLSREQGVGGQQLVLRGLRAELEPLLDEIVVTRNSSDRSMDPEKTAELAAEIFGEDRVQSAGRLDDAIETAVALADEATVAGVPGGGGVLITGSVITAG